MRNIKLLIMTLVLSTCVLISGSATTVKAESLSYSGYDSSIIDILPTHSVDVFSDASKYEEESPIELKFERGATELIVPLEITKVGSLIIGFEKPSEISGYFTYSLYANGSLSSKVGNEVTVNYDYKESSFNIKEKGTYELRVQFKRSYSDNADVDATLSGEIYVIPNTQTLKNKAWYVGYQDYNTTKVDTLKFKATSDGYVTVKISPSPSISYASSYFTLLDSNKKAISRRDYESPIKDTDSDDNGLIVKTYAVKKGTYYITNESSYGVYTYTYTFKAIESVAGTKKENAKTLKLGSSAVKGLMRQTDSLKTAQWFKFTLSKASNITLTINSKIDESLRYEIIPVNSKTTIFGAKSIIYQAEGKTELKSNSKFPAGSYYVKIYKDTVQSSGYYTIKIK